MQPFMMQNDRWHIYINDSSIHLKGETVAISTYILCFCRYH